MRLRFKLDENLDPKLANCLESAGHGAATVVAQGLRGSSDEVVSEVCRVEQRCLITADVGFANLLQYRPGDYAGIIVLRHPSPSLKAYRDLIEQLLIAVSEQDPTGALWIVEPGRVRIRTLRPSQ